MKILVFAGSLFLTVLGLVTVLTVFSANPATAGEPCPAEYSCIYELYCSSETGPECSNPLFPYYGYAINGWCTSGNSHHYCPDHFAMCCRFSD